MKNDIECALSPRFIDKKWPQDAIDPRKSKFPFCIVWSPLPIVSWLAPFFGHVGIALEDGEIVDFSGSNLVNVNNFAFGGVARYFQVDREQCCFSPFIGGRCHTCKVAYMHTEYGSATTWNDALKSSASRYESKTYNLFTCNSHSFVACCLNRLCFGGMLRWNMVNVAALVLWKGKWVDRKSAVRSFFPFLAVLCFGVLMVGWPFVLGLLSFSFLLLAWFFVCNYVYGLS